MAGIRKGQFVPKVGGNNIYGTGFACPVVRDTEESILVKPWDRPCTHAVRTKKMKKKNINQLFGDRSGILVQFFGSFEVLATLFFIPSKHGFYFEVFFSGELDPLKKTLFPDGLHNENVEKNGKIEGRTYILCGISYLLYVGVCGYVTWISYNIRASFNFTGFSTFLLLKLTEEKYYQFPFHENTYPL